MSEREHCWNCAFGQNETGQFGYKCRRHAPIPVAGEYGVAKVWPPVSADDFCGDWELKDAK